MQNPIAVTVSNTHAQVVGAGGVGFRLEPLVNVQTGNPVAMAVTVRLDRQVWKVFPLTDDAPRHFAERFEVMEIVGGTLGDQWLVTVFDTAEDKVGAPARVQPKAVIIAEKTSFTASEAVGGFFYLTGPRGGTEASTQGVPPPPFDVTRFRNLQLYCGALIDPDPAVPGSQPQMGVLLELHGGPAPSPDFDELGATQVVVANRAQAVVYAGEAVPADPGEVLEVETATLAVRPGWVRVGFAFSEALGVSAPNRVVKSGTYIRLVGLE